MKEVTNQSHHCIRLILQLLFMLVWILSNLFGLSFFLSVSLLLGKSHLGLIYLWLGSFFCNRMRMAIVTTIREIVCYQLLNEEETNDTCNDDTVCVHLLWVMGMAFMTMIMVTVVMSMIVRVTITSTQMG